MDLQDLEFPVSQTANNQVAPDILKKAIESAGITNVYHVIHEHDEAIIKVCSEDANLFTDAQQATIDGLVTAHPGDTLKYLRAIVKNARAFFSEILNQYAAENIAMGITQAGKTKDVSDYLADVMRYGESGSLYEVISEVDALKAATVPADLAPFVTDARLDEVRAKIVEYLS